MNNNFTDENIKKIIAWKDYVDKGYYGDARDIVDTYNEVFKGIRQIQAYTTCGSCIRRCVLNMWGEYQQHLEDLEKAKLEVLQTIDEFFREKDEEKERIEEAPKKKGRPKKDK